MKQISNFEEFSALPNSVQTGFYKVVALQIIMSGSIYHNQRINELREFFTERTTQFLGEMDAHEYVLTKDFKDQYQNHVAMTMVSNLTALDIFIKG